MLSENKNSLTKPFIQGLKEKVLSGGEIFFENALKLASIEPVEDIEMLLAAAHELTLHFRTERPDLCALVNAKSYSCGEDCRFCSQASRYKTDAQRYPLMSSDEIVQIAKKSEADGVKSFCVVTSGETLDEKEFEQVRETFKRLSEETTLSLDGSLGTLTADQARELKQAGMRRFNHNLQCSREFYPNIVSTHTYDERMETLDFLKVHGLEVCSGGIFGMGETHEDRLKLAFELKKYTPHCLPVNVLNPRPGTPLAERGPVDPYEILKMVAIYRFIHPNANIKLAGGRELNLGVYFQEKALRGGANGLVIGGYLTTGGSPIDEDLEMLKRAGYDITASKEPATQKIP